MGFVLAFFAVCDLAIAFSLRTGTELSGGWFGLVGYTGVLFWVMAVRWREYWNRPRFWITVAGLLVIHLLGFGVILERYPGWRMIWFAPIIIVEAGIISTIFSALLGRRSES